MASSQRTRARKFVRIAVLVIATTAALGAMPASAHAAETPPFEAVFPQEAEVTDFIDSWGYARSGGRSHKGNDLMAPKMTEVYAVATGVVEKVGTAGLSGRYVRIRHNDGWTSYYMHLNNDDPGTDNGAADWSLTVAEGVVEGSTVIAGQLIGWVGDSGNAEGTPPHTHFELRKNRTAVDPYPVLKPAHEQALEQVRLEREQRAARVDEILASDPTSTGWFSDRMVAG